MGAAERLVQKIMREDVSTTADSDLNVQYLDTFEGPTFRIRNNPPGLLIEINQRVIEGIDKQPGKLSDLQREITDLVANYFDLRWRRLSPGE